MDPVLVAVAFAVRRGTALHYLADTVNTARLGATRDQQPPQRIPSPEPVR